MKGHFRKRGDRWYFWAELEAGPEGKRRQTSKGGFRTRKEAEAAFAALRDQVRGGTYIAPTRNTLADFLVDEWLPAMRATVRPSTWDHYESIIDWHVLPRLGALRLQTLSAPRLNAVYAEKRKDKLDWLGCFRVRKQLLKKAVRRHTSSIGRSKFLGHSSDVFDQN